jgi:ABC-type antimicrobial peptide transport system permease subunit
MYVPQAQAPDLLSTLRGTMPVFVARGRAAGGEVERAIARGRRPGGEVERAVTEALHAVDGGLPLPQAFPLADLVDGSLARERFAATLLSVFALLALALTACGIYGVLAYAVRERRREIGIRMALGAGRRAVTRMVVVQGIAPVLVGLLLGVAGAAGLSRVLAAYLWGVTPTDPGTYAAVAGVLLLVALAASWIPVREAVGVDPVEALGGE